MKVVDACSGHSADDWRANRQRIASLFPTAPSLRPRQTRADSASLRFVPVMMSSHRGAPDSPLTPGGVESSVSYGRRPLRESPDIRALPSSRRPRPSRERQTGVTGRFPVRRAEPTFLADEMSAPADFQVSDAVSEERTSGRSDALSVRNWRIFRSACVALAEAGYHVHFLSCNKTGFVPRSPDLGPRPWPLILRRSRHPAAGSKQPGRSGAEAAYSSK